VDSKAGSSFVKTKLGTAARRGKSMNSQTTMQTPTTKSPCGCGGSGGASASPCSCGGQGSSTCMSGSYVRPLFFAGQLLTEDDLQTLANYVAGKNRLHNRYLFGPGVVCGLQVSCDPCHCGQVTVSPGYALDCCGNDIFVSCPQTLDINKMIRDLLIKMRGVDCGDPCAGTSSSTGQTATGSASPASAGNSSSVKDGSKHHNHPKKYCLYINYCEQSSDPVTPYATDNPCGGNVICQATRVYEGFTFELRCPPTQKCEPPICASFWNCITDQKSAERQARDARFLLPYASRLAQAVREVRDEPLPKPNLGALQQHTDELSVRLGILESESKKTHLATEMAEGVLQAAGKLAAALAVIVSHEWESGQRRDDPFKVIRSAIEALAKLESDSVRKALIAAYPESIERSYASAVVDVCARLRSELSRPSDRTEELSIVLPPHPIRDLQILLLGRGVVYTRRFQVEIARSLENMRAWLQLHLDLSPNSTIGLSASKLNSILLPPLTEPVELSHGQVSMTAEASISLSRYVRWVLRSCFCNALLPPCPSCSDGGVLLACVTVEDCCVKEICNLDRQFILSPVTIRYWIPEIAQFGDAIEKWCCPEEDCQETATNESREGLAATLGKVPEYVELALEAILRGCPSPSRKDAASRTSLLQFLSRAFPERKFDQEEKEQAEVESEVRHGGVNLEERFQRLMIELRGLRSEHRKLLAKVERLEKKAGD